MMDKVLLTLGKEFTSSNTHKQEYTKKELKKVQNANQYIRVCTDANVKIVLFFQPFASVVMLQGISKTSLVIFLCNPTRTFFYIMFKQNEVLKATYIF